MLACGIGCNALQTVSLPASYDWNEYNGHYYALTQNTYYGTQDDYADQRTPTWLDAEDEAIAAGGHLVAINTQAENDWLTDTFGTNPFWIGLNDLGTEGNWR
jgi:hypothetical protein